MEEADQTRVPLEHTGHTDTFIHKLPIVDHRTPKERELLDEVVDGHARNLHHRAFEAVIAITTGWGGGEVRLVCQYSLQFPW